MTSLTWIRKTTLALALCVTISFASSTPGPATHESTGKGTTPDLGVLSGAAVVAALAAKRAFTLFARRRRS